MAVVVGKMVAILEAQTAQFDARMSAAGQQLDRWNSASGAAHRGTALLRSGFQSLALDGLGSIPGPLGKVIAGFGSLALGSTLATGVLGLAGLIVTAWHNVAQAAQESARHIADLRAQYIRLQDSQIGSLQLQIAGVNAPVGGKTNVELENRAKVLMKLLTSRDQVGGANPQPLFRELTAIQTELVLRKAITDELNRQIKKTIELRGIEAAKEADFYSYAYRLRLKFAPGGFGPEAYTQHFLNNPFANSSTMFGRQPTPEAVKPVSRIDALQIAQLAAGSMMMLTSGGGGGAMVGLGTMASGLGAMKGLGAAAGPLGWVGLGLTTLGSIFGDKMDAKERADQKRHQELIGALHEGPMRQTNIFEGDPEQSLYQNRRLERLGGEPRNGGL